jgi:DNA-binding NarL/FixJ family response regulator
MISDIVEQLVIDDVALDIAARFDTRELIEDKLRAILPDLVLVGLSPGESEKIGLSLSAVVPDAKVIVFSSDGRSAYVSAKGTSWTHLTDFSPDAITSVIRTIRTGRSI